MRVLTSILLILTGFGLVAYSYAGAYIQLLREMDRSESLEEVSDPIFKLFEYLLTGGAPQLSGFLYLGLLLFAIGVVTLIVRSKRDDALDADE